MGSQRQSSSLPAKRGKGAFLASSPRDLASESAADFSLDISRIRDGLEVRTTVMVGAFYHRHAHLS